MPMPTIAGVERPFLETGDGEGEEGEVAVGGVVSGVGVR